VEAEQDFPNDGVEHVGIIAQELESVLPQAVRKVPGTLYKGSGGDEMLLYDSVPIIMALINACKELEKIDFEQLKYIKSLEDRLTILEKKFLNILKTERKNGLSCNSN